uniref:Uncharacterized protein n=1 Tax=Anguilla anguilla TaxID=7936 RepID=A0A0E9QNJ5_ANGAN
MQTWKLLSFPQVIFVNGSMTHKELPFILLYVSILSVKFSFADELTQFTIQYNQYGCYLPGNHLLTFIVFEQRVGSHKSVTV